MKSDAYSVVARASLSSAPIISGSGISSAGGAAPAQQIAMPFGACNAHGMPRLARLYRKLGFRKIQSFKIFRPDLEMMKFAAVA